MRQFRAADEGTSKLDVALFAVLDDDLGGWNDRAFAVSAGKPPKRCTKTRHENPVRRQPASPACADSTTNVPIAATGEVDDGGQEAYIPYQVLRN